MKKSLQLACLALVDLQEGNKTHGTISSICMYFMIQYITSFSLLLSVPWKEPHDAPKSWGFSSWHYHCNKTGMVLEDLCYEHLLQLVKQNSLKLKQINNGKNKPFQIKILTIPCSQEKY